MERSPASPAERPLDSYYERGYHAKHHRQLIEDEEYFRARAYAVSHYYFSPVERQLRIFEYGCGTGQNMALLPNAEGWDISGEALDVCRRRGLRVYDRIADVRRNEYDMVFCRHVLEHVERPIDALREMATLVRPGGEVCLVVPRELHGHAGFDPDLSYHLHCWNFRTLNNLCARAGLKPHRNETRFPFGWHALLPVRRWLGDRAYNGLTLAGQILRRNGELIVRSRPESPRPQ